MKSQDHIINEVIAKGLKERWIKPGVNMTSFLKAAAEVIEAYQELSSGYTYKFKPMTEKPDDGAEKLFFSPTEGFSVARYNRDSFHKIKEPPIYWAEIVDHRS